MLEPVRTGCYRLRKIALLALAAVGLLLSLACHSSSNDRAPSITAQPANRTVASGAIASFIASADGNPAPTLIWQRSVGSTWTDISGSTMSSYAFTTTAADDNIQFRMVAANGSGTAASNPATLRVQHLSITTQPVAQVAVAPALATFAVVAVGNPTPTYQWQRSNDGGTVWADIASATSASYTTAATSATDNGAKFQVVVSNGVSAAVTSQAVALTVNVAPAITTQPASLTITAPAAAGFTGAATGLPTPTTQWQRSNDGGTTWSDIAGATSATYSLSSTSASDNGAKFRLVASNGIGTAATSAVATLTMNAAPGITTQPASQTVVAPATATFSVVATGLPAPSYQWQRSDDAGSTWANVASGGTSATYITAATAAADNSAKFRVVLSNGIGTAATSSAATLTVNVAPSITTQPVGQTVTSPAAATFTVAGTGLPTPTIQWQRSDDAGTTWADVTGATSATYTTAATAASDHGARFRAVLSNGIGSAATSTAVLLTVNVAPAITTQPTPQTVTSPAAATFTVAGTGIPTPTIQWQRSNDGGTTWADLTGATSATYTTAATTGNDDAARFRVVLSNGIGSAATSAAVLLTVNVAPSITTQPVGQTVTAPATATFTVAGTGLPTPTYQWQRSNDSGTTWGNVSGGGTSASYTTAATSVSDNSARFRAILSNGIGTDATSSSVTLSVYAAPSVAEFSVSPTSVTVGSGAVLSYTFTGTSAKIGTSDGGSDVAASVTSGGTTNVAPGSTTTYYLTVANPANAIASATTTLTVNPPVTISGNAGVAGATLHYLDGTSKTATADGTGAYSFAVSYGWTGTVTPTMAGYTFSPIKRSYANAIANASAENFTATAGTTWISYAAGSYGGGDGSLGDPYLIATPEQLAKLSVDAAFDVAFSGGKHFTQVAHLDLAAHQWVPIVEFRGNYEGGGYRVRNMNIDNAGGDYLGVFGKLNSGTLVSNLGVTNASLNGYHYVGAVAGFASTATVSHCYSSGTIAGWGNLGGLVGAMDTAFNLSYSQSSCAVTGSAPNDQSYSGGLIGALWGGTTTISNCFATGTITGWENTGGLVGLAYHSGSLTMTNCYSTGNVITPRTGNWWGNVGGLVGVCASNVTLTNVYHSGTVTMLYPPDNAGKTGGLVGGNDGYPLSVVNGSYNSANTPGQGGGTALTTADMQAEAFLIALNGAQDPAPWVADGTGANQGFPMLSGLASPGLFVSPATVSLAPRAAQTFTAFAGSGTGYVWSVTTNQSGGSIDAGTGVYTAGSVGGVTDTVQAADSLGDLTKATVTITAGVSISPSSVSLTAGGAQTLSASGGSGAGYAWSITGNNSGGNIGASTGVYTAGPAGGVTDTVRVTDSLGNTATRSITVVAAPSISGFSVSPTSVTVGSGAVLSYTFTGASAKIGTSDGASDVAASVSSGGTTNVSPVITTTYYLTVANTLNTTTSATATLTVTGVAPTILTEPTAHQYAAVGQMFYFTVTASGTPSPTWRWMRNNGAGWGYIAGGNGAYLVGADTSTYHTDPLVAGDNNAQFRVEVFNTVGSVYSSAFTLTVNPATPTVVTQPQAVSVVAPATAFFSVFATGEPPPSYQWQRSTDSGVTWTDLSNGTGATTSAYTTPATVPTDNAALYRVKLNNGGADVFSNAATLSVNIYKLTTGTVSNANLDAVLDSTNSGHMVYDRGGRVYYRKDAGAEEDLGPGTFPAIAVGNDLRPQVVYNDGLGNIGYAVKTAGVWTASTALTGLGGYLMSLDVDANNFAHLALESGGGYGVIRYTNNATGTFEGNLSTLAVGAYWGGGSGGYYRYAVIKVDASGYYYIAYRYDNWGGKVSWSDSSIHVMTNNPVPIAGVAGSSSSLGWSSATSLGRRALAFDGSGNLHLIYNSSSQIYQAMINAAGWTETPLTTGSQEALAVNGSTVDVTWNTGSNKLSFITDTGTGFGAPTPVGTGASPVSLLAANGSRYFCFLSNDGVADQVYVWINEVP